MTFFLSRLCRARTHAAAACCFFLVSLPATVVPAFTQGLGDLTVSPTRVIFEERTRAAQLTLIHRGSRPATYRLSFVQMRMDEHGELAEIREPGPGERFADPLIRFAPRQVTLEPQIAQTVRLMLRKPADLPPGEYRSHLLFRAIPPADAGNSIETAGEGEDGIEIRLTPVYGVSVPVVVRHGELGVRAMLDEVAFEALDEELDGPALSLRLRRSGERSLYGDLRVSYLPERGGETVLELFRGVAVYTPNAERRLRLPLAPPEGLALRGGRLKVTFSESDRADPAVAEAELPIS